MSSRVSQPLPSVSNHAGPNWALEYPVRGARPLTGKFSAALSAVWELACVGEVGGARLDDGCAEGRLDGDAECAGEVGLGGDETGVSVGCTDVPMSVASESEAGGLALPFTAPKAITKAVMPVTIHFVRRGVSGRRHSRMKPGMMHRRKPTMIAGHEYTHPR